MQLRAKLLRYLITVFFILTLGISFGYHQITPIRAPKNYNDQIISIDDVSGIDADFTMIMSHVYHMAKEPHPSGSEEIERVRDYLKRQFKAIDTEYQEQMFTINMKDKIVKEVASYHAYIESNPNEKEALEEYFASLGFSSYEEKYRDQIRCTESDFLDCVNYLVKLDAPNTEQGVIFVSHYDSTNNGPGAADDLISVATMLEVLRNEKNKNEFTNDIYFLFTDAEELQLYGAEAFVRDYPELKNNINLVINLEARGTSGSLVMFETSLQNKNIIKELNKTLDHNTMFSFTAAVYRIMPNDTDLTRFLEKGYSGVNFAILGSPQNYHQMTDNYENLDRDSAYMYYKTVSDLADHFGKVDLQDLESNEDAVYFPFLKGNTFVISNLAMFIFSCVIGIFSLVWICYLIFQKKNKLKDIFIIFAKLILCLVIAALLGLGGAFIYNKVWSSGTWIDLVDTLDIIFYAICFLVILVTLLLIWIITRRTKDKQSLLLSAIIIFNLLNWATTILFNSIAYIFTIPLFLLLLYSVGRYFTNSKKMKMKKLVVILFIVIQGFIVCILYTPIIYLLYTALISDFLYANMLLLSLAVLPTGILCASLYTNKESETSLG